ncbi:hypothetical protein QNI19_08395 [Cytophagaceae bacterium DM2B3-1]|uniref:SMI1/KNR4 family protein n=1 Tax=Xanthocytophaga flava TaxID=3048013 RepID=A0ABT7CGT6_9BACT|nr:hypothetical protein [Xanthocytophaga flavus]MDJ1471067.1 hypothetical protein [Xanthocytophaga flavus]MDJ1492948.1 hypothetical protein [Xanthocytophaga flavus]
MIDFEPFAQVFGTPLSGTGVDLASLKLSHSVELLEFVTTIGSGCFSNGLVSIASQREQVSDLGGWEHWLPPSTYLFGSTCFGFLFCTSGNDLWLIDTHYGEIIESDFSITDFINDLAQTDVQGDILKRSFFRSWFTLSGRSVLDVVLSPTPAIPLGGSWDISTLSPMPMSLYLPFTGQMFSPESGMPATVHRLQQ